MPKPLPQLDEKRLEYAKEAIRLYGSQIPQQTQINILEQSG